MFEVTVIVREPGRKKPDYSLPFSLPALPREGEYISIHRPDATPWTEDLIVRKVWWHLSHSDTGAIGSGQKGKATDIMVECDIAEGPTSSDHWRKVVNAARDKDIDVEYLDVDRFSAPQG